MSNQIGGGSSGKTNDQYSKFDPQYAFKRQNKRTLADIDILYMRQEELRKQIGVEKAEQIEKNPDLFYNHEKFRLAQHAAMFWTAVSSVIGLPVIFNSLNGGRGGFEYAKKNKLISLPVIGFYLLANFCILNRYKGYNNYDYICHTYAKNHKMLRNIIIKE